MTPKRDITIDTLRGVACILLVSYHVIGSNDTNGLKLSEGFYRTLNDFLVYIRMPLFTFLSGYVYANRPYKNDFNRYIVGKARRLLLPMLYVGTTFAVLQSIVDGSNNQTQNWHLLHIVPVAHFWFIEAIFIIFLCMIFLEHYKLLSSISNCSLVFGLSVFLYTHNNNIDIEYFAFSGAIYLFPYFLFGLLVNRFKLEDKLGFFLIGVILLTTISILYGIADDYISVESKYSFVSLIIGCLSCFLLLSFRLKSALLAQIGVFSYSIYLYHVFFTAGSRIVFTNIGVTNISLLFFISLLVGIIGPVMVDVVFKKNKFLRKNLLGK
ncbi:hypothetical protein SE23_06380 [Vibrio sinaloensis]|uniref:acyltransferase family protein n=1 Tax=Photobacterium sp. (strain ATCC 43367) TaxID=379097 RepID=UPI0005808016|nr:acyltransferase [Vibrio sinaloensis]KIE21834.1 hypothetical protein SE23_06380 [Vibrio sinaloensis]